MQAALASQLQAAIAQVQLNQHNHLQGAPPSPTAAAAACESDLAAARVRLDSLQKGVCMYVYMHICLHAPRDSLQKVALSLSLSLYFSHYFSLSLSLSRLSMACKALQSMVLFSA